MEESGSAALHTLARILPDRLILPGEPDYESGRRVWNGALDHHPAAIARCETAADVQAAIRIARAHGLPLSVRGGGHDWAGRVVRHDGLVIDLSAMRRVEIDPVDHVATVAGGATAVDVIAAAAPHRLVAVTGNCGSVGMAGLTLGGGYGMLTPRHGLALDNLLGVEIVLADGRKIVADAVEHPDLFWALRGGGGNFGVVTSMRIRLHPCETFLCGVIAFPWCETAAVLRGYADMSATAPDELAVLAGILSAPDGTPTVFLAPNWCGEPEQGERVLARLQSLGNPIAVQVGSTRYGDLLGMFDRHIVSGRHYAVHTRWLPELTPHVITTIAAAGGAPTSPLSAIALHHFHGAPTRVPLADTAFGLREPHFMVEIIAAWDADGDEAVMAEDASLHHEWARSVSRRLSCAAFPGGYPNFLGAEQHCQVAAAYGDNAARLLEVKRRFDPHRIFAATPLPC